MVVDVLGGKGSNFDNENKIITNISKTALLEKNNSSLPTISIYVYVR